jgi:hypothetical protein
MWRMYARRRFYWGALAWQWRQGHWHCPCQVCLLLMCRTAWQRPCQWRPAECLCQWPAGPQTWWQAL